MKRFQFRLAGHLKMTVEDMLNRMSAMELTYWIAFAGLEPIGDYRGDVQAATVACAVMNSQGAKTKVKDLVPKYDQVEVNPEDKFKRMRMMMNVFANTTNAVQAVKKRA